MAQYNADIRIGVTGKAQLNQLEAQLKRTQVQLNKLNKSLQLRTRVQAIRLDTRAANTAIKQLEQRINKLGRTITVNLRVNEREGRKSSNAIINNESAVQFAALGTRQLNNQLGVQRKITTELKSQTAAQRVQSRIKDQIAKNDQEIVRRQQELARLNKTLPEQGGKASFQDQLKALQDAGKLSRKVSKQFDNLQARLTAEGKGPADAGKEFRRFFEGLPASVRKNMGLAEDAVRKSVAQQKTALEGLAKRQEQLANRSARVEIAAENRITENLQREQRERLAASREYWNKRMRQQDRALQASILREQKKTKGGFGKGAVAGGGFAASSALAGVPGLGGAVAGGTAGFFVGGPLGAVGGALAGGIIELTSAVAAFSNESKDFNNQLGLMRRALANTVSTTDELETALTGIRGVSEDFLVPIGDATEQFTKLNAAARASGFTVEEVEEVYRGLAAANVALGGDSQKLQGILLATQQVFSKGKVQAEELRGQIGERLAGAFAKFAESAGLSTSELDKALERGEVSLEDFVRFAKSLLDEYEEDAKKLADAPENAATRLKIAMDNLREAMGPITQGIGNMFTDMATQIVNSLTAAIRAAQRVPLEIARAQMQSAVDAFTEAEEGDWNYNRRIRTMNRAIDNYQKRLAAYNALTMPDLNPTGNAPGNRNQNQNTNTNTGGSRSGPRDTTAELTAAIALEKELLEIEKQRNGLSGLLGDLREQDLQRQTALAELEERRKVIQTQNITDESKKLAVTLAELQAKRDLQSIENATAGIIKDATQASVDGARELIESTNLVAANEQRRKELLEQGINPALADALIQVENQFAEKRKMLDVDIALLENALLRVEAESEVAKKLQEQLDKLKELKGELDESEGKAKGNAKDQNPGKIKEYMNQLQEELKDTEGMVVQMAQTVENELGRAMSSAITGLIDGTTKAEEAFATMFRNIGQAFIDMATQMIAKALIMKALGILTGGAGGGGGSAVPSSAYGDFSIAGPDFFSGGMIPGFAEGGFVTGPTNALIGESGEPEFVIPQSKMSGALERYNAGARGEAVLKGASSTDPTGMRPMNSEPLQVNITGGITQIGGEDYIRKDQLPSIIDQASTAGETKALRRLRMSQSSRQKVGI